MPAAGAGERPGIRAFVQASNVTITFRDVPPGTWRLILRAPGFQDLVIDASLDVTAGGVTDADAIPADVEEQLVSVSPPPGSISTEVLIRLLIALLISILTSLGIR